MTKRNCYRRGHCRKATRILVGMMAYLSSHTSSGDVHKRFAAEVNRSRFKVSGKHVASQIAESIEVISSQSLIKILKSRILTTYVNAGASWTA